MQFQGKIVVITGGARWIWRATALYFWKEGAQVVITYLTSEKEAFVVVDTISRLWWHAIAVKCDVSIEWDVISMVDWVIEQFGKIDICINNAWFSQEVPIFERTVEQWKKTIDTNLLGTFLCTRYVLRRMLDRQIIWWKIINLSSLQGIKHFSSDLIDYDISKAWIIVLTKEFAKIAWPNIRINAIAPGNIDNRDYENPTWDSSEDDDNTIYLWRFWKITEVAKSIIFLASDDSSFVNGTTLFLDGWCD